MPSSPVNFPLQPKYVFTHPVLPALIEYTAIAMLNNNEIDKNTEKAIVHPMLGLIKAT
jgi:hypothetical protein